VFKRGSDCETHVNKKTKYRQQSCAAQQIQLPVSPLHDWRKAPFCTTVSYEMSEAPNSSLAFPHTDIGSGTDKTLVLLERGLHLKQNRFVHPIWNLSRHGFVALWLFVFVWVVLCCFCFLVLCVSILLLWNVTKEQDYVSVLYQLTFAALQLGPCVN